MSIVMPIGLLLVVVVVLVTLWRFTRSKKQFVVASLFAALLFCGLLFTLYFPAYQWYSFSIGDTVISGDNNIPYKAPRLGQAYGPYNLTIQPLNHTNLIYRIEGHVESGANIIGSFSADLSEAEGSSNNTIAIRLDQKSGRDGMIRITVVDGNPPNQYRIWIGRYL